MKLVRHIEPKTIEYVYAGKALPTFTRHIFYVEYETQRTCIPITYADTSDILDIFTALKNYVPLDFSAYRKQPQSYKVKHQIKTADITNSGMTEAEYLEYFEEALAKKVLVVIE
jgi:hypothetical protein